MAEYPRVANEEMDVAVDLGELQQGPVEDCSTGLDSLRRKHRQPMPTGNVGLQKNGLHRLCRHSPTLSAQWTLFNALIHTHNYKKQGMSEDW